MITQSKTSIVNPRAIAVANTISEPDSESDALKIPAWKEAMWSEYDALMLVPDNHVLRRWNLEGDVE